MKVSSPQLAKIAVEILRSKKVITLQELLELSYKHFFPDQLDSIITDHAAASLEKVRFQLNKFLNNCMERRVSAPFKWGEIDRNVIITIHNHNEDYSLEPETSRFRLTDEVNDYLKKIDPSLFEKLGQGLLQMIGSYGFKTRRSQDEGVDFGGLLYVSPTDENHEYPLASRILQNLFLRFIGQAKRYTDEVPVQDMRALHGVHHERIIQRLLETHGDNAVVKELVNSAFPLILIFITTGRFTRASKRYADDVGMITLDGEQISQVLLQGYICCKRNEAGEWSFDEEALLNWIKNQ